MRILLAGNAASIHTQRWALGLQERGHTVAVASDVDWPEAPVPIYALPAVGAGRVNVLNVAARLRDAARDFGADVLHAHYVSHYGLLAALVRVRPTVMSVWGADVEVFPRRSRLHRALVVWILRHADAVTASSRYLAEATQALAPDRRIAVVPFGIDTTFFRPPEVAPPAPPYVLVSNKHLEPVYGGDVILRVAARLAVRWPLRVVLLGEGSARAALTALAQELHIAALVEMPGALSPSGVRTVLQQAHVALYPSRRESFGVATLEAMATGLPVVAARVGGLPELVRDGETGRLVDGEAVDAWADAVERLLADAALREAWGREARRRVEATFTMARALDRLEAVYTEVGSWR